MAANDKTTTLQGSLKTVPSGGISPTELIELAATTPTYQTYATGSLTRAAGGSAVTIDFSVYGITNASFFYLKARDVSTGLGKSVLLTCTQLTTTVAGLVPTATFAHLCTDFFHCSYENPSLQQVVVTFQSSGNSTEINWAVGG